MPANGQEAAGRSWEDLVAHLNVWKNGTERAVYKPLLVLMLLARAQHKESNCLTFREIDRPLRRLMEEFGPPRGMYSPELPFWHLQNDGFWTVEGAEGLTRRKGKDRPTRTALLKGNPVGCVPLPLWDELLKEPRLVTRLGRSVLEDFWPDTLHESILAATGLDISTEAKRQARDPVFRLTILRAYEGRCAVCGHDARLGNALLGLDAAHIQWHAYQGPDHVSNGLALCSLHHVAFDRGALGLDEGLRMCVSQDLVGHEMVQKTLISFNGQRIIGPQQPTQVPHVDFIRWHRKWVFRSPARDFIPL
jgi:putative restriction endonuclease